MHEKILNKKQVIEYLHTLPDDKVCLVFSDEKWTYPLNLPFNNRDQKNCPMLDMNFTIEKAPGVIIYIRNIIMTKDEKMINAG